MAIWKNVIGTTGLLIGHSAIKFVGLIQKLGEMVKGKDKVYQEKLLE